MNIEFEANQHRYRVNGEIAGISITQLLRKHGLAPDFSAVKKEVVEAAAERGTDIHKDLECLISYPAYDPFTPEGASFKKYIEDFIDCAAAEQMVAFKYQSMWIAGTADIIGFFKKADKGCFVADHKTTSVVHREAVSWQVSIIDYILRHTHEPINGKTINWKGADELLCFHYTKDGELEVVKLDRIPDEEIERLFACEYFGEKYERKMLVVDNEIALNLDNVTLAINRAETTLKKLKAQQDKYKDIIKDAMREQGIKSYEDDVIKITYVGAIEKTVVDSEKLKRTYPQVWEDVQKISKVKDSVRIKIKGEEDE